MVRGTPRLAALRIPRRSAVRIPCPAALRIPCRSAVRIPCPAALRIPCPSASRVPRRSAVGLAGVLLVLVFGAAAASAHTTLVDAEPAARSTVTTFDEVVLTFGTPIVFDGDAVLALATVDGADLPIGAAESPDELTLRASVPDPPEPGRYVIRYQVVSIDGDLNDGGYQFIYDPDADSTGTGGWVLLGVGIASIVAIGWLLRPGAGAGARAGRDEVANRI